MGRAHRPAKRGGNRDFLAGLRALINHVPRVLSLIVSTRQPLNEVCQDVRFMGSPFYNNFVFIHLRPFSQDEAETLLKQMLSDTGVSFSLEEEAYIYDLAGTQPLLLQAAASLVFEVKLAGARARSRISLPSGSASASWSSTSSRISGNGRSRADARSSPPWRGADSGGR